MELSFRLNFTKSSSELTIYKIGTSYIGLNFGTNPRYFDHFMTFDFSKTIGISQSLIHDTLCALILTKAPLPCSFLSLMDDPLA